MRWNFTRCLMLIAVTAPLQALAGMTVEGFSISGTLSQQTLETKHSAPSNFDYLNNQPAAPAAKIQQLRSQGLSDEQISEQLVQEVTKKMNKLRRDENPDYLPEIGLTAGQDRAEIRRSIQLQASGGIEGTFRFRVTEGNCTVTAGGLVTGTRAGICIVQAYEGWSNPETDTRQEYTSAGLSLEFYDSCPREGTPLALAVAARILIVGETTQILAEGGQRAHCLAGNTDYLFVAPGAYCQVTESGIASASRSGRCDYTVYAGGLREEEFAQTVTITFMDGVSVESSGGGEDAKADDETKSGEENSSRSAPK